MSYFKKIIGIVLALGMLAGCATTTRFTNLWRDAKYVEPKMSKVLVVGVFGKEGPRRSFETDFTSILKRRKIDAVASHELYPEKNQMDQEQLMDLVKNHGFDGVIIVRLIGVEKRREYSPGYSTVMPSYRYYDNYYGYYSKSYTVTHTPGYYTEYDETRLETALYVVSTKRLIWSGSTATDTRDNYQQEMNDYMKLIVTSIQDAGFF